jgi:hypothetical protein
MFMDSCHRHARARMQTTHTHHLLVGSSDSREAHGWTCTHVVCVCVLCVWVCVSGCACGRCVMDAQTRIIVN